VSLAGFTEVVDVCAQPKCTCVLQSWRTPDSGKVSMCIRKEWVERNSRAPVRH